MAKTYKTHHMGICVQGVLEWPKRDFKRIAKAFNNEDGSKPTEREVRQFLYNKLKEGYETIPLSGIYCEGWDKINGCPGHEITEEEYNSRHKVDKQETK